MARIYASSKRGQSLIARAKVNQGTELRQVYTKWSLEKEREMAKCRQKCYEMDGYNFHICSHNTWQFSVAWETVDAYYIETAQNSYVVYKNW